MDVITGEDAQTRIASYKQYVSSLDHRRWKVSGCQSFVAASINVLSALLLFQENLGVAEFAIYQGLDDCKKCLKVMFSKKYEEF